MSDGANDIDDETVVVNRGMPSELDDETVVVQRAAVPVVPVVSAELEDETVVVQRAAPASVAPAGGEPDDETVVVDRGVPDDRTVVVDRTAPVDPTAPIDSDETLVVPRAAVGGPIVQPAVPGQVENARVAFTPGDSTGLLKDRYHIRSSVTEVPGVVHRHQVDAAPSRHSSRAIADVAAKTQKANRSRGLTVLVTVIAVTIATALLIGVVLLVVFAN